MRQGEPQASLRAMRSDHAELWNRSPFAVQSSPAACTAGAGRFLRQKIPFSRAKFASLQFPRPKIRRILAETGRGARRPPPVAETGRSKPNKQGSSAFIGGREAAEASRTQSEAKSAEAKHRAAEDGTVRRCRTTIANCGALALPSTSLSKKLFDKLHWRSCGAPVLQRGNGDGDTNSLSRR